MKKQLTYLVTALTIATLLTGCGPKVEAPITTLPTVEQEADIPATAAPEIDIEIETEVTTAPTGKPATPKPTEKPQNKPVINPDAKPETKPEDVTLSASDVFDKIMEGLDPVPQMAADDTMIADMYGIDTTLLDSYHAVFPMMSAHINETAVFKVKDSKDIDTIKAGITKRVESMGKMLYPSLVEILDNHKIVSKGNYVVFVVDDKVDTIVDNFNNLMK